MDNELNKDKPKAKPKKKGLSGVVLKDIKIGSKYDWIRGEKVNGLSKEEYNNYKQNKIIR